MGWLVVAAVVVAVLLVVLAVIWLIGARLPVGHVASRQVRIERPPEEVWRALTDVASYPSWRSRLKRVEVLDGEPERPRWREFGSDGKITFEVVEAEPPRRLVTRIVDDELPFGGSWTYRLEQDGDGCRLAVTEDGEVYNVFFRFMSRYVFGHTTTIDGYLKALGARYGQRVTPEPVA
jgi:polyketide cyclase/dehydrase/lipid transport protein